MPRPLSGVGCAPSSALAAESAPKRPNSDTAVRQANDNVPGVRTFASKRNHRTQAYHLLLGKLGENLESLQALHTADVQQVLQRRQSVDEAE